MWKIIVPLGLLALMIGYHRLANRMNVPRPIYWITRGAGGFLMMSIFELW